MTGRDGLRWWEGTATPGPLGYLLAVPVSAVAFGAFNALAGLFYAVVPGPAAAVGEAVTSFVLFTAVAAAYASLVGPPGVVVVHLVCCRVRAQAVHVGVAGIVGFAAWQVASPLLLTGEVVWSSPLAVLLGLSTATGRACVIPLVPGVHRRRARRRPGNPVLRRPGPG